MNAFVYECRTLGLSVAVEDFEDYLHDESKFTGTAFAVIRARTEQDVRAVLARAQRLRVPITVVSGKTSLTGAPVPVGGAILDVKDLDAIDPDDPATVGPGIVVKQYKDHVDSLGFFYPPDPTSQDSCTLGGNIACNASGALSYLYGPTREYIQALRIVLPTGYSLDVERGDIFSTNGLLTIPRDRTSPRAPADIVIPVPGKGTQPWHVCKSAAGLYSSQPMDLIDLFIGDEGILGVSVQVKTRLIPRRKPYFALMIFLPTRRVTVLLVQLLDALRRLGSTGDRAATRDIRTLLGDPDAQDLDCSPEGFCGIVPSCMEWFGMSVASFVSTELSSKLRRFYGMLYVEQEYDAAEGPLEIASRWSELMELLRVKEGIGEADLDIEVALDEAQVRRLREQRRTIPEKLNEAIAPGAVKHGLDFAVPLRHLDKLLELYDAFLPAGKSYVFGHIGNAHLHANMLPQTPEELAECRAIHDRLAKEVCSLGGTVSGEHGIGKLKHDDLELMLGREGIAEICRIKKIMDPNGILNRGNMIRAECYVG